MQRERLYRAGPGRYIAVEDVDPQQSDDLPLRKGMEVEGVCVYLYSLDTLIIIMYNIYGMEVEGVCVYLYSLDTLILCIIYTQLLLFYTC